MWLLVHGNATSVDLVKRELPMFNVAQLISPACHHGSIPGVPFAIDNGAFKGLKPDEFTRLLDRERPNRDRCLFVAAPDVVGSARRTLEVFRYWYPRLSGWPIALVAQDGLEDLEIPWRLIRAVFIGGSTEWKMGRHAEAVIRAAQAVGRYVHVGRVNTAQRLEKFLEMGVDSIDGASISRHGAGYSRDRRKIAGRMNAPKLPYPEAAA